MTELGAEVWRGGGRHEAQGVRILGAAFGSAAFVDKFGDDRADDTLAFLDKISQAPLTQHAWLLTHYCLVPRANHVLRQTPPSLARHSAERHDAVTAEALRRLLGCADISDMPAEAITQARLPPRLGGLGLRDCKRTSPAAYWASFADCLPHLCARFPRYGALLADRFAADPGDGSSLQDVPSLAEVQAARRVLETEGTPLPDFNALAMGARPEDPLDEEGDDRSEFRHGWQRLASRRREEHDFNALLRHSSRRDKARLRSCGGKNNSRWLTTLPTGEALRLSNQVLQVLIRRRLGLPISADPGL